jgi:hypothetical protein
MRANIFGIAIMVAIIFGVFKWHFGLNSAPSDYRCSVAVLGRGATAPLNSIPLDDKTSRMSVCAELTEHRGIASVACLHVDLSGLY